MAKKLKKSTDASTVCPGCGRKCLVLEQHDNGDWLAVHEYGKRLVQSSVTLLDVMCGVLLDGCTPLGKIGYNHVKAVKVEADKVEVMEDF